MGNTCSETWVTQLIMDCLARELRDAVVGGVSRGTARGRAFYEAYGFTLLEETPRTVWYGIALP